MINKKFNISNLILLVVLSASLLNNIYGVTYGLPYTYDPDEPIFVTTAGAILSSRDLNPHWFGHPGTTTIYLLAGLYGFIYIAGRLLGFFSSAEDFRLMYHVDPTLTYLSGRLLMVAFSVATVFLVIQIGTRVFNRKVGITAGLITALSPLYVQYSKLIRTDIQVTFWLLLSLWFCLDILQNDRLRNYVWAGFFLGIAVATKYPAVVFSIVIFLSFLFAGSQKFTRVYKVLVSALASIVGAFVGSPFLFLKFSSAFSDILKEARVEHLSHTGGGFIENLIWYVHSPLLGALSFIGLSLVAVGICLAFYRRFKQAIVIAAFPLLFLVFISSLNLRWDRWMIPAIPFLCLLLAYALYEIGAKINGLMKVPYYGYGVGIASLLIIAMPMINTDLLNGASLSGPPTRTQTANWMLQNIPEGSRILMEIYDPILPKEKFLFYQVNAEGQLEQFMPASSYKNKFSASGHLGDLRDTTEIFDQQIEYVVLSQMYSRYKAEQEKYPEVVFGYEQIISMGVPVYHVEAQLGVSTGPSIQIYQIREP